MKNAIPLTVVAVAFALAACKSTGPRFDPRDPNSGQLAPERSGGTGGRTAQLGDESFVAADGTNRVPAEWLRPSKELYRLGPGDVVEIENLSEPGPRGGSAVVGPDGKIYYNLLPGTFVWGLTLAEVKGELEKGLKKYVRAEPDLSVILRSANSRTVWLLGNVQNPGLYPLQTPLTVLGAISQAGGTIGTAGAVDGICDLQRSFVMREGKLIPIDFERLLREGDLSQNIYLQPSDFVYLRSGLTRNVYVMGAVASPNIVPYGGGLTLMGAILSSGGTVPYAQVSQVAVIRGSMAAPRIATVDFKEIIRGRAADIRLAAGDIVYVPFSPWRKLGQMAESVLDQFVRTVAANEGYRAFGGKGTVTPTLPLNPLLNPLPDLTTPR